MIVLEREDKLWNHFSFFCEAKLFFSFGFQLKHILCSLKKKYTWCQGCRCSNILEVRRWGSRWFSFYFTVALNTCYTGLPRCVAFLVLLLCQLTATSDFICPSQWTIVLRSQREQICGRKCWSACKMHLRVKKNVRSLFVFFLSFLVAKAVKVNSVDVDAVITLLMARLFTDLILIPPENRS